MSLPLGGLWPPLATPFSANGEIDLSLLIAHASQLLAEGADGLTLLGTTGEANSLSLRERRGLIEALAGAGLPPARMLVGTGGCAIEDVVELSRLAGDLCCAGVLIMPPFYYKKIVDEGLFTFYARLIEQLGANPPRILLYHIPQVAGVGLSLELIGKLREAFPEILVGIKDSSGDLAHAKAIIASFPGFKVFVGTERDAIEAMRAGASGVISGAGNINAAASARLLAAREAPEASAWLEDINQTRAVLSRYGNIEAVKAILAVRYGDQAWAMPRPPLLPLSPAARQALYAEEHIAKLLASNLPGPRLPGPREA